MWQALEKWQLHVVLIGNSLERDAWRSGWTRGKTWVRLTVQTSFMCKCFESTRNGARRRHTTKHTRDEHDSGAGEKLVVIARKMMISFCVVQLKTYVLTDLVTCTLTSIITGWNDDEMQRLNISGLAGYSSKQHVTPGKDIINEVIHQSLEGEM